MLIKIEDFPGGTRPFSLSETIFFILFLMTLKWLDVLNLLADVTTLIRIPLVFASAKNLYQDLRNNKNPSLSVKDVGYFTTSTKDALSTSSH